MFCNFLQISDPVDLYNVFWRQKSIAKHLAKNLAKRWSAISPLLSPDKLFWRQAPKSTDSTPKNIMISPGFFLNVFVMFLLFGFILWLVYCFIFPNKSQATSNKSHKGATHVKKTFATTSKKLPTHPKKWWQMLSLPEPWLRELFPDKRHQGA